MLYEMPTLEVLVGAWVECLYISLPLLSIRAENVLIDSQHVGKGMFW